MSQIIYSVEQTTANMMKSERERYIKDLYINGIITKQEYTILQEVVVC